MPDGIGMNPTLRSVIDRMSAFRAAGWGGAAVVAAGRAGPRVGAELLCSPPPQLPSDHADGGEEREEEDEEPVGESKACTRHASFDSIGDMSNIQSFGVSVEGEAEHAMNLLPRKIRVASWFAAVPPF